MRYYKIISNNQIQMVSTSNNFLKYQPLTNMLVGATKETAEYLECDSNLYHATWMKPIATNKYDYTIIEIDEISKEEYDILVPAIENNPIPIEEDEEEIITPENINELDNLTLDFVRTSKINEMSKACNQVIEAGFDITLSDNLQHHFSLTTQDQLNLISLSSMAANGMEAIPYHADGEICKFYSAADISEIVSQATAFKIYHTTYFNALKNYINSLNTIEEIAAITYGVALPEEYQSDVLKALTQ